MSLIKQINDNATKLAEDAAGGATGGGAVAVVAMPLFSTLVGRTKPVPKKKKRAKAPTLGIAEAFYQLAEVEMPGADTAPTAPSRETPFDSTEIIAKLKGLERKEEVDHRDTVTFGLTDDNDEIVRVTIKHDQAEDFESALQAMLTAQDGSEELPEIAEILYNLKDQFDIIDVHWPNVEEDEEENVELTGAEGDSPEGLDDMGAPGDADMDPSMGEPPAGGDTGEVTGLLTQVIDMMKADAEARKAEARAREAEAKTKEADSVVAQSLSRVKQEEQYLDMETYNKARKDEDREAKRLAQLAKWKHSMSQSNSGDMDDADVFGSSLKPNRDASPEEEETTRPNNRTRGSTVRSRVAPHDIAQFIINRVK